MAHIPYGYIISEGRDIPRGRTCLGKMLKNPVYLGDDYYPQIIDAELFEAVSNERQRRYEAHGCPTKAAPISTVPIQTRFRMMQINEKYKDPVRQAEYVYGRIKDW